MNAAEDPAASDGQEDSIGLRLHAIAVHDRFPLLTGPPSGRVSPSGREVVFTLYASLVAGDGNTTRDIYVMDVSTRRVTLETPGAGGHLQMERASTPISAGMGGLSCSSPQLAT